MSPSLFDQAPTSPISSAGSHSIPDSGAKASAHAPDDFVFAATKRLAQQQPAEVSSLLDYFQMKVFM
jgi:hypothetical protein